MKDFLIEKFHLYYLLVAVFSRGFSAFIVYSSESTWNSRRKSLHLSLWNVHPWGFSSTNEANILSTKFQQQKYFFKTFKSFFFKAFGSVSRRCDIAEEENKTLDNNIVFFPFFYLITLQLDNFLYWKNRQTITESSIKTMSDVQFEGLFGSMSVYSWDSPVK